MTIPPYKATPIEELEQAYMRLHERFNSGATLSLDYRIYNLKQLAYLIKDNEKRIQECLKRDLDKGALDANMCDVFPVYNDIDLAIRRLPTWMKNEGRMRDSMMFYKPFRPKVMRQPKGVALIISPWNYPWQCAFGPLVSAIAAGCPAILKPSELAPSSSALLAELVPQYLDTEAYAVVNGAIPETTRLLEKQWGHILFTGSVKVGKIVATAAAKTLTPTTLELGGKSPVIVSPCADMRLTARRLLSIKPIGNGQVCVAPDYILCPRERVDDLVAALKEILGKFFPKSPDSRSALHSPITCALRSPEEFERQQMFLKEAEDAGKTVIRGEMDEARRRMGISLVVLNEGAKGEVSRLVEEEIFGPVLPIIPVKDVDEAVAYVNARPRPLALYVCSANRSVFLDVIKRTVSGSATWNDFCFVAITRSVPFGGVGESGWGAYHGFDGFKTFSHEKALLEMPYILEPVLSIRYGLASPVIQRIIRFVLCAEVPFKRPVSVENETFKRRMRSVRDGVVVLILLLAGGWTLGAYLYPSLALNRGPGWKGLW